MDNLMMSGSVLALCGGSFCAGVLLGRFKRVQEYYRAPAELVAALRDVRKLKSAGYNLVRAIAKLRDKETGGAAYAQTAVNAWSTAVLQVEGDKP